MTPTMTSDKHELLKLMLAKKGIRLGKAESLRPRVSGDELPLSFAQERLWFIDQLQPGLAAYNMAGAVRLMGELSVGVLAWVVDEIIRRHEVLRTTFKLVAGKPV